eukprot:NODE_30_length_32972_cov_0.541052.p14 type:complete len:195 gc:universal NODE_30_length_32972_cov_0.541052:9611-9027(-)
MKSRSSSATSYYSCISATLPHTDSKFAGKSGFQSTSDIPRLEELERELETIYKVNAAIEKELDIYKKQLAAHNEEMALKSTLIQKLLLELQSVKSDRNDMLGSEAYYKEELHSKTCELELTSKMLNEFHKVFKSLEKRAFEAESSKIKQSKILERQDRILKKQALELEHKEAVVKHIDMKLKFAKILKKSKSNK